MTAQEIMGHVERKSWDSFDATSLKPKDNISGYWGLDMEASGKLGVYEQFQFRSQFQLRCYC